MQVICNNYWVLMEHESMGPKLTQAESFIFGVSMQGLDRYGIMKIICDRGKSTMGIGLIVGNLCTLLAMGANALSSTQKTSKNVLRVQNLSQACYFASGIALGGYSAAVQNVVSILRNVAAIRNIQSKTVEWILTAAGVVLGIVFNNRGLMGLLPVLGNLQYTLAIFRVKDNERLLKTSFLLSTVTYVIYNVVIMNYVGVACDSFVCITTAIVLLKGIKKKA